MELEAEVAAACKAFFLELCLVLLLGPSEDIVSSFTLFPRLVVVAHMLDVTYSIFVPLSLMSILRLSS